ncbi:hypothetical protein [Wenjunlia tyrosinilytica]|uniref:Uncharacterized protein n=1 Tax=Wenjunlia tyrosinilytica TaxID=1544741 RepID=A0A917ZWN3_9ACTN|nr:hypothetical protein [Wenjunlia tyrosinilytica]GGO98189.1 hypothetical protein GCM10012280_61740 [Wenjunlia tyrosinilytica]
MFVILLLLALVLAVGALLGSVSVLRWAARLMSFRGLLVLVVVVMLAGNADAVGTWLNHLFPGGALGAFAPAAAALHALGDALGWLVQAVMLFVLLPFVLLGVVAALLAAVWK